MSDLSDFAVHMTVWGWSPSGHDDLAVFVAEFPALGADHGWWDRRAEDLDGWVLAVGDDDYQRVPDHWALPALAALRALHDREFWDIVS